MCFFVEKSIKSLQIGFNVPLKDSKYLKSEQCFQNVPFSAIDYSFATKALCTGQRNYQKLFIGSYFFAGNVVGPWPMKTKKKMHGMIVSFICTSTLLN